MIIIRCYIFCNKYTYYVDDCNHVNVRVLASLRILKVKNGINSSTLIWHFKRDENMYSLSFSSVYLNIKYSRPIKVNSSKWYIFYQLKQRIWYDVNKPLKAYCITNELSRNWYQNMNIRASYWNGAVIRNGYLIIHVTSSVYRFVQRTLRR